MHTHPLWREYEQVGEEEAKNARVELDDAERWRKAIAVTAPDPRWCAQFDEVAAAVSSAVGHHAVSIGHVGSTSVPGLAAKPIIDVDLVVTDSADEPSYLPQLEAAGFVLIIREPDWEEHRMFKWDRIDTNLHVFSSDSVEPHRHRAFRDWLTAHEEDRTAYADLKQQLATVGFDDVMAYNNAKSGLIYDIYERIFAADPAHAHDPHPRSS